jgi:hypothetical protein
MTEAAQLAARDAVRDLERARRDARRTRIDIWEAIYQAYVAGFAIAAAAAAVVSVLPEDQVTPAQLVTVVKYSPAAIGLVIAVAVAIGLRSGSRGGPLVFDPPTVHYLFQSPVDRGFVTRRTGLNQLRSAVTWGIGGGLAVGVGASAALPGGIFWLGLGAGIVGILASLALFGAALLASGRKINTPIANIVGLAVVGWSVADLATGTITSPFSMVGRLGLLQDTAGYTSLVGIVIVLLLLLAAFGSAASVSLEAALRRSGLVSQIRFALTMQDLRTVVVLRRRLTGHTHRKRPWIPVPRSRGNRLPALRRTAYGLLHAPPSTLFRAAVLGVGSGISLGLAARWAAPMALVTGLLLFVAAYDFVESLAQEIDKPTLWANKPIPAGDIVVRLTLAGAACMAPVVVISILAALIVGGGDIAAIALMTLPATAIAAAVGAAVSTALGAPTMSATTMQSEMFALTTVPRILAPPAIAVIPMLPVVAGLVGDSPGGVTGIDSLFLMGVTCGLAMLWLRKRHPEMT